MAAQHEKAEQQGQQVQSCHGEAHPVKAPQPASVPLAHNERSTESGREVTSEKVARIGPPAALQREMAVV